MRFLIALALLGCDDGTGTTCPDPTGLEPEDYIAPAEIARAEAEGVRDCVLQLRLNSTSVNRCTSEEYAVVVVSTDSLINSCKNAPPFEPLTQCFEVWASGSCTEMLNSPEPCNAGAKNLRYNRQLLCP